MGKIKWILMAFLLTLLVYTRFVNLTWGLPYPFHPDERNMAVALQQLQCQFSIFNFQFSKGCLNPHFFAYGQLPLYLAYLIVQINHLLRGGIAETNFVEAVLALRIISALASIINAIVLLKIVGLVNKKSKLGQLAAFLLITFSPFFIQLAHFGTTESLLMLFYSLVVYWTILFSQKKISASTFYFSTAVTCGLAIATKVSAVIFIIVSLLGILRNLGDLGRLGIVKFLTLTLLVAVIFSPYNFIDFRGFLGSMRYESSVALGKEIVFYTRQFVGSIPVYFQLAKIFPYALGWPIFIFFILGFLFLPWKNSLINILRLSFIVYFIPNAFMFAKWTRFMAPVLPIMVLIAALFLISLKLKSKNYLLFLLTLAMIVPGIAYLSIYQNPDVRIEASAWIYKNIPANSIILSETANVVDLPLSVADSQLQISNFQYLSFDFYHLDEDPKLKEELAAYLAKADYIFIPSRRIFMNHPKKNYPLLNDYYRKLFSGDLAFEKVAEFSSFPKISFLSRTWLEYPDEGAEETWSVFDHPVIRIYEKVKH